MKDDTDEINMILDILGLNPDGVIIKDIAAELNLNRDTIARHLRVLLMKGDVEIKQIGPAKIYYRSRRIPTSVLKNFCPYPQVYFNKLMRITEINTEFRKLAGPVPEVIVGKKPDELDIQLFLDETLNMYYKTALNGCKTVKYLNTSLNGNNYYFKVILLPVVLEDGRAGLCIILIDKTASASSKDITEKSEDFYRTIVEDQTEYICRVMPDGTFTYANRAYCEMRGKSPDELIGRKFLPLNLNKIISGNFSGFTVDNPVITEEIQVVLPNGEISWQQWKIRGIFDDNHILTEFQMAGRDFTELKRAEEQIKMYHSNLEILIKERTNELQAINRELIEEISERKETEDRLNLAIEGSKYAFWDWDLVTDRAVFGRKLTEMLGLYPEDMNNNIDSWRTRVHPEDLPHVIQSQKDHFSGISDYYEAEYRMKHKDGYYVWMYAIGRVSSRGLDGTPIRMSGLQSDISEKIQIKKDFEFQKLLINSLSQISGLKEATELCLENAVKYTDLNSGCFYTYDKYNDKFRLLSSYGLYNSETECLNNIESYPEINLKISGAGPQYISIKNSFQKENNIHELNDYKSVAIIPVKYNNIPAGIFCLFSKEFDEIPDAARNTLESASGLLNGTLLRIKTDGEIIKTQKHLAFALNVAKMAIFEINLQNEMMTFYYPDKRAIKGSEYILKKVQIPWKRSLHPEDYEKVTKAIEDHANGSVPYYRSIHRVISDDGSVAWYSNSGKIVEWDDKNRPLIISGVSANITEEKVKPFIQE
ncbi:PAS domain-containing protein [Methanoplanus endosymbiosus]|uniref:histidine kinase n=1 Tax=Methanoplanus endosymbiosus TaxID=33865 RepID=A0A9E7TKM4_9EURY|nr:PAS domain-containing protein [Methanoplanus endosymbiosus]UUX92879.1 PAS domain-containing protein [Methanoplanus endosymbiosus]